MRIFLRKMSLNIISQFLFGISFDDKNDQTFLSLVKACLFYF